MALDKLVADAFVARKKRAGSPYLVLDLHDQGYAYDRKTVVASMKRSGDWLALSCHIPCLVHNKKSRVGSESACVILMVYYCAGTIHDFFFLRSAANPTIPAPIRQRVEGSGTGAAWYEKVVMLGVAKEPAKFSDEN